MPEVQKPSFNYADQPQLSETFADALHTMVWDGQTLRIEFCVTRYPDLEAAGEPRATRHPVARMVLTPAATADLHQRLRQTVEALTKAGVFKEVAGQNQALSGLQGGPQAGQASSGTAEPGLGEATAPPRSGLI